MSRYQTDSIIPGKWYVSEGYHVQRTQAGADLEFEEGGTHNRRIAGAFNTKQEADDWADKHPNDNPYVWQASEEKVES